MNLTPQLSPTPWVLAIDLGGTTIKLGLFNNGVLVHRQSIDTADYEAPDHIFREAKRFFEQQFFEHVHRHCLSAIGLAMPGILAGEDDSLEESSNLTRWQGLSFRKAAADVFGCHVSVINDANAAALGEACAMDKPESSIVFITIGTGVGGGIVIDGEPLKGAHGCAGEIGHMPIDVSSSARACGCGRYGHVETYCGAAGIVQTASEILSACDKPSLLREIGLSPLAIKHAADQGDPVALETVRITARYLGRAISLLAHVVDPDGVLLGGAINFGGKGTSTGELFLEAIRQECEIRSLVQVGTQIEIDFAKLGSDAGMFGAAQFATAQLLRRFVPLHP